MDPRLVEALEPVLRDVRSTVGVVPELRDEPWSDYPGQVSGMMWAVDGSAWGVWVMAGDTPPERVVVAADQVQEWVVEQLWGLRRSTSWPGCPEHPDTHPLAPMLRDGVPVWSCPRSDSVVCGIGALES